MTEDTKRPRRILLLINTLGIGGAETLVANLARALRAAGAVPVVCGWRQGGAHAERLRADGVVVMPPVGSHSALSRLLVPLRLARLVRRHRIDLVHSHLSDSAAWALALRALCRTPAIVTHHSNNLTDNIERPGRLYAGFRDWLLRLCARHADLNVVVSPSVRERLENAVTLPSRQVALIANGVRVEASAGDRTPDRRPLILYAGRLMPEKGIDLLIEAIPAVLAERPDARFVLLGEGSLRAALEKRIRDLGITGQVDLVGAVPDIGPWLARAALVAVPSRVEGLPVTVLEAMACGVPVVATDIPGNRDLIGAQEHGWLCDAEAPDALAGALVAALEQPALAAARAARAHDMVAAQYSLDAMARRYLAAYDQVLAAG